MIHLFRIFQFLPLGDFGPTFRSDSLINFCLKHTKMSIIILKQCIWDSFDYGIIILVLIEITTTFLNIDFKV